MSLPAYEPGQARAYAAAQGWKTRTSGENLSIDQCPICGRGGFKFYVNDTTGLWIDHHASCGRRGNWFQLLKEMGETVVERREVAPEVAKRPTRYPLSAMEPFKDQLMSSEAGIGYLAERGLTRETAERWNLGLKTENGADWLLIPYIHDGEIVDIKYRSLPPAPKQYRRKGGGDSVLFGEHFLDFSVPKEQRTSLFLCEGELDAMTLAQHGYAGVLSTTTGAGSFKPRWYDVITAYDPQTIYVVYDTDVAGQDGAAALLKKFDDRHVLNVVLPGVKDINEYFLTHTREDFEALLHTAKPVEIEHVMPLASVVDRLETELYLHGEGFIGYRSQFESINTLLGGGYWKGFLVTVSGGAGMGKTSYVMQELFWGATQGYPAYMLCLEMPEEMMLRKLIEHRFHIPKLELTMAKLQTVRRDIDSVPFYMGSSVASIEDLEKTIRAAVKRYDLKLVGFDNVNYFVRSSEHEHQQIAIVTKLLKTLAVELGITILNISQPTAAANRDSESRVMTYNDLKGSSAIAADSDVVMLFNRRRNVTDMKSFAAGSASSGIFYPECLVRVDKARYASGGETYLYFHGDISTFRELTVDEMAHATTR